MAIKYTLEDFKKKYYDKYPNSDFEILELLPGSKLICKNKYGKYKVGITNMLKFNKPSTFSLIDKYEYFINRVKESKNKNKNYNYSFVKIIDFNKKIKIICKEHGPFLQKVSSHINGHGCLKCSNKYASRENRIIKSEKGNLFKTKSTNDFIKKANEIFNNKYIYDKTNYINSKSIVIITCPIHGDFEKRARNHINGTGCHKCVINNHKGVINNYNYNYNKLNFSYTLWDQLGLKSKNFDSFKVYIIKCWNDDEIFYKIGKTFLKMNKRFSCKKSMPYNYEIIKIIEGKSKEISILEKKLHQSHKKYIYKPLMQFGGKHECFSKIDEKNRIN